MNLWISERCVEWQAALDEYPEIIRAQREQGLGALDEWYRGDFPQVIAQRKPAYITRAELQQVTLWKMKRGVWRERNRLLVASNSPGPVKNVSRRALDALPDVRVPISLLSTLAGVGPATASAILAACSPTLFPFLDELVAQQIPNLGAVSFTRAYYQRYAAALRERAAKLNDQCDRRVWTAHAVSQALWAASGGKAAQASKPSKV